MGLFFPVRRKFAAAVLSLSIFILISVPDSALSQSLHLSGSNFNSGNSWEHASSSQNFDPDLNLDGTSGEGGLPAAPEPAGFGGGGYDHYAAAPPAYWHQRPLSRVGFGADVSLLGLGLKSAVVLNQNFDLRVLGNFFSHPDTKFKIDGVGGTADIHLASASAAIDWYPFANGTIWRISPGVMFLNQNQVSVVGGINAGTGFKLGGTQYYSANRNPATGATPITGTGGIVLHSKTPAFTATTGFGSFVPRSNRHWSFPSEFGVIFAGASKVKLHASGWACLDEAQTECSNISDTSNPVGKEFTENLNLHIAHWQQQLNKVGLYPVFSYSVMYSFNVPHR